MGKLDKNWIFWKKIVNLKKKLNIKKVGNLENGKKLVIWNKNWKFRKFGNSEKITKFGK